MWSRSPCGPGILPGAARAGLGPDAAGVRLAAPVALRRGRAAYLAGFALGWLLFALAPVALAGAGPGGLRVSGMLAGVALPGAATGGFARFLRCSRRDSLVLALLAVVLFPLPLLLLTRRYRRALRAAHAPRN